MKTTRRYDIDWLRVIAIWLLLIYHIAIIFQPWAMFFGFIRSDELMESLWKPMSMLNVWRIPLLFYVSGMGVFFALKKRNWKQLIVERTRRILVPFIFGFLAITPLHMFVFQRYYNMPFDYFPHTGHLWFLGNIFAYLIILLPLFFYLKKHEQSSFTKKLTAFMGSPVSHLVIALIFVLEYYVVNPQIFEVYAETFHGFVLGLLAFFFGFLFMYTGKTSWQTLSTWRWLYTLLASLLYALRITTLEINIPDFLVAIESNLWIFGLFGFGYKYLNHPSSTLNYLSKAAYPVYIIHMFVLYAAAFIILPLDISVHLKFPLVVVCTFIICYLMYEYLITRFWLLRPLFGLNKISGKNSPDLQLVKKSTH